MKATANKPTATGIATPDTRNETKIGYEDYTTKWTKKDANGFWPADYLYQRKGKHYKHLDQINQGLKNGPSWYNQAYINVCTNRDLIKHISDSLELLPREEGRAIRYFLGQDLRKWGIRKELVAWAVCAYIVHSDEQDIRRSHPKAKSRTEAPEDDDRATQFWDFAYQFEFTMNERVSTYHKVMTDMETPAPSKRGREGGI